MRLSGYLCLGGVEVANDSRTVAYVRNGGIPLSGNMSSGCSCDIYDTGFNLPETDPSPWHEPTRPESDEFYGLMATGISLSPVHQRATGNRGGNGSVLSPLRHVGRVIPVTGFLFARSAEGMAYGERWLSEVLRGSPCSSGDCPSDDAIIVPACPDDPDYDTDRYFRTLVDVGVVDGPTTAPVINSECYLQQVNFTLTSSQPWLYHSRDRCLDGEPLDSYGGLSCALTTPEWMGEGTFVIDITNIGTTDMEDITITGQISLDGSCPVSGAGTSVAPSFSYTIPTLAPEDRIVIDGMRRQVRFYDASAKTASNGLQYVSFFGPWRFPDVGACTTMCLTLDVASGEGEVTVDSILREV